MTFFLNAITNLRHPEERPKGRVSKDAQRFRSLLFRHLATYAKVHILPACRLEAY